MRVPSRAATWRCWSPETIGEMVAESRPKTKRPSKLLGRSLQRVERLEVEDRAQACAGLVLAVAPVARRRGHRASRRPRSGRRGRHVIRHARARTGTNVGGDVE